LRIIDNYSNLINILKGNNISKRIENVMFKDLKISGQYIGLINEIESFDNVIFSNCVFEGGGYQSFEYTPTVTLSIYQDLKFLNCTFSKCAVETRSSGDYYTTGYDGYNVTFNSCEVQDTLVLDGYKNSVLLINSLMKSRIRIFNLPEYNHVLNFVSSEIKEIDIMDRALINNNTLNFSGCTIDSFKFLGTPPSIRELKKSGSSIKSLFSGQIHNMVFTGGITHCDLSHVDFSGWISKPTLFYVQESNVENADMRGLKFDYKGGCRVVLDRCVGIDTVRYPEGTKIEVDKELISAWFPESNKL